MSYPLILSTSLRRRHRSHEHAADPVRRLTVAEDTKIPNAATITINKEDHTLANMIKASVSSFLLTRHLADRICHAADNWSNFPT